MDRVQLSAVNLLSFHEEDAETNRRRPGRVRCERLQCRGGRVLDLSMTGARLIVGSVTRPRRGQRRTVVFKAAMGESVAFPAVICWVRGRGFLRWEVGVQFERLDDLRLAQLKEMSRVHGGRTIVRDLDAAA